MSTTSRLPHIDIAKGVLMLVVIFHHVAWVPMFSQTWNPLFERVLSYRYCYMTYFMAVFFIISGLCSHFDRPFLPFLKRNFLALMVPQLVINPLAWLVYGYTWQQILHEMTYTWYGIWFLQSLFLAKMLYWGIHWLCSRKGCWWLYVPILIGINVLGIYLAHHQVEHNYWNYIQALVMCPFLLVGQCLQEGSLPGGYRPLEDPHKPLDRRQRWTVRITVGFVVVWTLLQCAVKMHTDSVTNYPDVTWGGWATFWVVSGLAAVAYLWLGGQIWIHCPAWLSRWLARLGRQSLVVYIFHIYYLILMCDALRDVLPTMTRTQSAMTFVAFYLIALFGSLLTCRLLNTRWLSWSLGRWELPWPRRK